MVLGAQGKWIQTKEDALKFILLLNLFRSRLHNRCVFCVHFKIRNLNVLCTAALIYDSAPKAKEEYVSLLTYITHVLYGLSGASIYGDEFIHKVNI